MPHAVNAAPIQMTPEGLANLRGELAKLEGEVPALVKAISLAREDKDFRENAPLEAAREALAFNETPPPRSQCHPPPRRRRRCQ